LTPSYLGSPRSLVSAADDREDKGPAESVGRLIVLATFSRKHAFKLLKAPPFNCPGRQRQLEVDERGKQTRHPSGGLTFGPKHGQGTVGLLAFHLLAEIRGFEIRQ
jgi:hypothetical protein